MCRCRKGDKRRWGWGCLTILRKRFLASTPANDHQGLRSQPLGCRPEVKFAGKKSRILLDQIRCVDKARLAGKMGEIDAALWHSVLMEMLG